jgi:hypothetical protein
LTRYKPPPPPLTFAASPNDLDLAWRNNDREGEEMTTTKRLSFALVAAALMFIFIAGLNSQSGVRAGGESAPQLEGSWVDDVTITSGPSAGATLKNLSTYSRGGGLVTLPAGGIPPPLHSSSGHGTWIHKGGREFAYTVWFFIYDPAGQHVFTLKINQAITMSESGDEYNANSTFDIFDPAGNLIPGFTGCGTVRGKRIKVEPPTACP